MRLSFHDDSPSQYPNGYWIALTDDEGWDADGPDPLIAVSRLTKVLEKELTKGLYRG